MLRPFARPRLARPRFASSGREHQRGAVAVEAALGLVILIGVGLIGSDMQRIHTERIRLENAAGVMALNLSAQAELSTAGLDELADMAMQEHVEEQQLIIMNVQPSGQITWALQRGEATDICEAPSASGIYTGELPEADPDEDENATGLSLLIVKACRDTNSITLSGGLTMPRVLETTSVFPITRTSISIDPDLQAESDSSGLAYTASSSSSTSS